MGAIFIYIRSSHGFQPDNNYNIVSSSGILEGSVLYNLPFTIQRLNVNTQHFKRRITEGERRRRKRK